MHIYGFTGDFVRVKGVIQLPLTLGEEPLSATQIFEFPVIDQPTFYNALLGRPVLKEMRVITSIHRLAKVSYTFRSRVCERLPI